MRKIIFSVAGIVLLAGAVMLSTRSDSDASAEPFDITVFKSPTCGCCTGWVGHLNDNDFSVTVNKLNDVSPIKIKNGVNRSLWSCHTALVDGYVIEGHVPAADIKRLLTERPDVVGLALPGMVVGSPGMSGPNPRHYNVLAFTKDGKTSVFARH